jgi:hypothetical protein
MQVCGARYAGIPTYGHFGLAGDINDSRIHGRDERVLVNRSFKGMSISTAL